MLPQTVSRSLIAVAVAAVATAAAACGGNQSSPVAPTPLSMAPSLPAGVATGATIAGTVLGAPTNSQYGTQRVPITVSASGSSSAAPIDDNGHFALNNVPAGHVDLHFMGTGIDAHLAVDVGEHATVAITVRLNGNDAHLEDDHGAPNQGPGNDHAELKGTINAGSLMGTCAAHTLSFTLGTTMVRTSGSTQFTDGTCESLRGGKRVEVKGTPQSDNSILAASVEGDEEEENEDNRQGAVELNGTIAIGSMTGACATSSLSFKVGSTLVKTNASTEFRNTSCASLKVGDSVEVKGARQSDASVLALRVEGRK